MKNAQIQTQIFIYILSMLIVGLVLLYGYNAISGFRERQGQLSLIEVENQLKNTINAMSSEWESIRPEEMQLPQNHKMICFVDNTYLGGSADCRLEYHNDPKVQDSGRVVDDAIKEGTANIFLIPDGTDNFKIGNLKIDGGCICIEKTGNFVKFKVIGLGNGVKITS